MLVSPCFNGTMDLPDLHALSPAWSLDTILLQKLLTKKTQIFEAFNCSPLSLLSFEQLNMNHDIKFEVKTNIKLILKEK